MIEKFIDNLYVLKTERSRKTFLINLFSLTALASLLFFGIKGIIEKRAFIYILVVFSFFLLTLTNIIVLKIKKNIKLASYLVLILMFLLEISLYSALGKGNTALFWYYVYPPLAITLVNNKRGTIFSVALIVVTLIINYTEPDFLKNSYDNETILRFIFTFIVVTVLINIFELARKISDKEYLSKLEEIEEKKQMLEQTEEKLRKNNNELKKLFTAIEQSSDTIVYTDTNGNIEYANPQFEKLTGYKIEEKKGKKLCVFDSENDNVSLKINIIEEIKLNNFWKGEFENTKKNNEIFWEKATISPIKNEKGEITNFLAIREDISQKKSYEKKLKAAKNKAEESANLKTAFLSNMSHEIRTPMNAILGYADILKRDNIPDERKEKIINTIKRNGNSLLNLINNIIYVSELSSHQLKVSENVINLNTFLLQLVEVFENQIKKGTTLSLINGLESGKDKIKIDYNLLKQTLNNLIDNSIKFTKEGRIEIGYSIIDDMIEFYVKDSGIGISKKQQKYIFDAFRQVDYSSTRKYGGTGLGLAISKGCSNLLGGDIRVESIKGTGSVFFFTAKFKPVK